MNEETILGLVVSVIEFGTLLYLAALGELIAEKSGVLNLGVEGMMAMGGMSAYWVGVETGDPWAALVFGAAVGAAFSMLHGITAVAIDAVDFASLNNHLKLHRPNRHEDARCGTTCQQQLTGIE